MVSTYVTLFMVVLKHDLTSTAYFQLKNSIHAPGSENGDCHNFQMLKLVECSLACQADVVCPVIPAGEAS